MREMPTNDALRKKYENGTLTPDDLRNVIELPPALGDILLRDGVDFSKVDFMVVNFTGRPPQMFVRDHVESITNVREARQTAVKNAGGVRRLPDHKYW